MDQQVRDSIKRGLERLGMVAWTQAKLSGFHGSPVPFSQQVALAHSELSEALEADREGDPQSRKIPPHTCREEELADVIIRVLDAAVEQGLNVAGAVVAKMEYNAGRPPMHGGKRY